LNREDNISGSLDWATIGLYLALVLFGWLNIYAVVYDESVQQSIFSLSLNSGRQLLFIIVSLFIIAGIVILDMRFYETFAYVLYALLMFTLLLIPCLRGRTPE
jgi:rod shape determining protein RodA